jgi:hypothetical protein
MPDENDPTSPIDPLAIGELITLDKAAESSGFSHASLRKYAGQGKLKAKKMGRDWFTTLAAVEDYKKNRYTKTVDSITYK